MVFDSTISIANYHDITEFSS